MACCPDCKSCRPRNGLPRKLTAADIESEVLTVVDDPTLEIQGGQIQGDKSFVNEAFGAARERFTEKRKDGAR